MFSKEVYVKRRAELKKQVGSGVLLFLGNDEMGLNYEDNAFIYDAPVADFMKERYLSDCENICDELTPSDVMEWSLGQRLLQGFLWLLSPLM